MIKTSSLWLSILLLFGRSGVAEELHVQRKTLKSQCFALYYSLARRVPEKPERIIAAVKDDLKPFLSQFKAHYPDYDVRLITAEIPAEYQGRTQSYWPIQTKIPMEIPFVVKSFSQSHTELMNTALLSQSKREFLRFIIHFKNGDTLSSTIHSGIAHHLTLDMREIKKVLDQIANKRIQNSHKKTFQLNDISGVEVAHNHPDAVFVLTSDKTERQVWLGDGISGGDFTSQLRFFAEFMKYLPIVNQNRFWLNMTILTPTRQALVFDPMRKKLFDEFIIDGEGGFIRKRVYRGDGGAFGIDID